MPNANNPEFNLESSSTLNLMSLREIQARPEPATRFIVEGLFPARGLSILAGKPKAGKSTLARQLGACIATGRDFLNREVYQGKVLHLALEENVFEVQRHFSEMDVEDGVFIHAGCVENPVTVLDHHLSGDPDIRLVVIDPLFKFISVRDVNDYARVNAALRPLADCARKFDVLILGVHHRKKSESENPSDGTLGSQAINGNADTVLTLRHDQSGKRILSSEQRTGRWMEPTLLDWNEENRTLSLAETLDEAKARQANQRRNKLALGMMTFLSQNPNSSREQLFAGVPARREVQVSVLRELQEGQSIVSIGGAVKGSPLTYCVRDIPTEAPVLIAA